MAQNMVYILVSILCTLKESVLCCWGQCSINVSWRWLILWFKFAMHLLSTCSGNYSDCNIKTFLLHVFWNSDLYAYTFKIPISSWLIDSHNEMVVFTPGIILSLKFTFSDVNIASHPSPIMIDVSVVYLFYSLTFNLFVSLCLKGILVEKVCWVWLFIPYEIFSLLIGVFISFTFNVIIEMA